MEATSTPWVQTGENKYEPSPELLEEMRSNPEKYPTAVDDIVKMSGMSREEVEARLNNPLRGNGVAGYVGWAMRPFNSTLRGVGQSLLEGVETIGEVSEDLTGYGEGLAKGAQDASKQMELGMDPGFSTEESTMREAAPEFVGNVAPAVVAGTGVTAGAGLIIKGKGVYSVARGALGTVGGSATSSLTFETSDPTALQGVAQLGDEFYDAELEEIVPDAVKVDEFDSETVKYGKQILGDLIIGVGVAAALTGSPKVLGTLKRILKKNDGNPEGAAREIQEKIPEVNDPAVRQAAETRKGQLSQEVQADEAEQLELFPQGPSGFSGLPPLTVGDDLVEASEDTLVQALEKGADVRISGVVRGRPQGPDGLPIVGLTDDQLSPLMALPKKAINMYNMRQMAKGDRFRITPAMQDASLLWSRNVFSLAMRGDSARALTMLRNGPKDVLPLVAANVQAATARALLEASTAEHKAIIKYIRMNPDESTKVALRKATEKNLTDLLALTEAYRDMGTSASHILLARQGLSKNVPLLSEMASDYLTATDDALKAMEIEATRLFTDEAEFAAMRSKQLLGASKFDPLVVLEASYKMFDDFAADRAGLGGRTALTPYEKANMIQRGIQVAQWYQVTQLLGQPMTALTNVLSTGTHMMSQPALRAMGRGITLADARRMYGGLWMGMKSVGGQNFMRSLKAGKDVADDFLKEEGAANFDPSQIKNTSLRIGARFLQFVSELAIATDSMFKSSYVFGAAYADAYDIAIRSGMGKKAAKDAARKYALERFGQEGAIIDADYQMLARRLPFQDAFDKNTMTGQLGLLVEDIRNKPYLSIVARSALPFFRTLMNLGRVGAQMTIPPGTPTLLKLLQNAGVNVAGTSRILGDFTGKNGELARSLAVGYSRLGTATFLLGMYVGSMDGVTITGISGMKQPDAKSQQMVERPPSSIIIGNQAFDLTRFLPFSAPLIMAGIMHEWLGDNEAKMEGGVYVQDNQSTAALTYYVPALLLTQIGMLQDAGFSRGVTQLFDGLNEAVTNQDIEPLKRYAGDIMQQYVPAAAKVLNRTAGGVQYEGYDPITRFLITAGIDVGHEKRDIFGHPLTYPIGRSWDPTNRREVRLNDPAYAEFAELNQSQGLDVKVPHPNRVLQKTDWVRVGILDNSPPMLNELKTKDGRNAYDFYRDIVVKGKASADDDIAVRGFSGIKVSVKKGENFETSIRRIIKTQGYQNAAPAMRKAVWASVFSWYTRQAKEATMKVTVVTPQTFDGSKYGSPISGPTTLDQAFEAGKKLGVQIESTAGNPVDQVFRSN